MTWKTLPSKEKREILLEYKDTKFSAAQIADRVLEDHGYKISRGVVIGAYFRAGVKLPASGMKRPKKIKPPAIRRPGQRMYRNVPARPPREVVAVQVTTPEPEMLRKAFADLEPGECKWAADDASGLDGPAMECCGQPTGDRKKPWCPHHQERSTKVTSAAPSQDWRRKTSARTGAWVK